ncbi:error-prone DNA polymerase [Winkia neuii]|uniref:error-prone DNA polymerase n=1 Tax=Winkia neuii TaxID=33007 RepID=UPI0007641F38|nr:error-prone DNA polymerase [Winkia neuii]
MSVPYCELHAHSAYSFLDGANEPAVLVRQAKRLGLEGIAITDYGGLYGAVQTNIAARQLGINALYGAELDVEGANIPILAQGPKGYSALSTVISDANLALGKRGKPGYTFEQLSQYAEGKFFILTGTKNGLLGKGRWQDATALNKLKDLFGSENVAVESALYGIPGEEPWADYLADLAAGANVPLVATTAARCGRISDRPLADVLAVTRMNTTLEEAQGLLPAARACLRSASEMVSLHRRHPEAVENASVIGQQCAFDLRLVAPALPQPAVPEGFTPASYLRYLTFQGAHERYGRKEENPAAYAQLEHELEIIEKLDFPGYFLIVWDIVQFCKRKNILCQGRGSAANSAVCFVLGITAVDAVANKMLFERFLSPLRSGPPDIDVDIEAVRREEVIQYVYQTYGRHHAGQVVAVQTYRPRSALRDAARALGHPAGRANAWTKYAFGGTHTRITRARGIPKEVAKISEALLRLPRHLGLHSGGMVLTREPVTSVCPVQWAALKNRTVLQWDKDDCADAGLVKFDLLGLGMLTALRIAFDGIQKDEARDVPLALHNMPAQDERVYELLQKADTVGVFQVESRAQMNTLPRLKPRTFYDIVVEVALIRPGPIQGQAVNPYINRRNGREAVTYLHPLVKPALEKTLGVPLFQEQLMQIAVDAAGLSPAEADELRKAMGAKRSAEKMARLEPAILWGMAQKGIGEKTAEQIFAQLKGFAEFGFPESHAFSFAYIVYASAWLKVHYPEYFYAGILAAQPMGFYSPESLVADARRHGVAVMGPCCNRSQVLPEVQEGNGSRDRITGKTILDVRPNKVVRLGLAAIKGVGRNWAERIVNERNLFGPYEGLQDFAERTGAPASILEALGQAGAFAFTGVQRREIMWAGAAVANPASKKAVYQPFLPGTAPVSTFPRLRAMGEHERMVADISSTGVSLGVHPFVHFRKALTLKVLAISELSKLQSGSHVWTAGLVTHRQRPHTARGTTFLSLEDETGLANVICSPGLWERYRQVATGSEALAVRGKIEACDGVMAVVADKLVQLCGDVSLGSRDFR